MVLPLAVFAPKGLAPLFILTFLVTIACAPRFGAIAECYKLSSNNALFIATLFILLLGVASTSWSFTPQHSLLAAITVGVMLLMGLGASRIGSLISVQNREIVEKYILFGGLLGFALLGTEYLTDSFFTRHILVILDKGVAPEKNLSYRLNSASSVGAIYIWPWTLILLRKLGLLPAVLLAGASGSVIARHSSAPLASVL